MGGGLWWGVCFSPRVHCFVWFFITPWGRFTHAAAETLMGYYWFGSLCKGLVVNPNHSPWKFLRSLQTRASRETQFVGKVCNLCRVKTDISTVLMKPMPHTSNNSIWRLFCRGIASGAVIPPCSWHLWHLRTKSFVSSYMIGQKNLLCQTFTWVWNTP